MSERPILFSGPMVRAILAGTKTQTRRVVRWPVFGKSDGSKRRVFTTDDATDPALLRLGPFGVPGDLLWVRETFAEVHPLQVADGRHSLPGRAAIPGPPRVDYRIIFRADGEYPRLHFQRGEQAHPWREVCEPGCDRDHLHPAEAWHGWASPIHMPRWASRITLEVTGVRVERLQEITEEDIAAEGITCPRCSGTGYKRMAEDFDECDYPSCGDTARPWWIEGWDTINGKRATWASNPWVWVVSFRRVQP